MNNDFIMEEDEFGFGDPPGGGLPFEDVTSVLLNGVTDMESDELLFMDGFTLQDAMSAFEIGEPRLDTGYVGDRESEPFNPLEPLLPEEVCWILDKALGYEMEWHAGNLLPHTIFTLQYIHHLRDIEPDMMTWQFLSKLDKDRPMELVTVVLGACTQGLLKCCDLVWRELHRNEQIQDTEDWQSDKCEVPTLEGVPVKFVLSRLEDAAMWVQHSDKVSQPWKEPLISRILLRKTLLELYNIDPAKHQLQYRSLLDQAHILLKDLSPKVQQTQPQPPAAPTPVPKPVFGPPLPPGFRPPHPPSQNGVSQPPLPPRPNEVLVTNTPMPPSTTHQDLPHPKTEATPQDAYTPPPSSPAHLAFDPHVSRRLNTCVPIRVIPIPADAVIWNAVARFLDGLGEVSALVREACLATWETAGKVRVWTGDAPMNAYVRSVTQSAFYNGVLVLEQYTFQWALDRLFFERVGVLWSEMAGVIKVSCGDDGPFLVQQVERKIYKLVINHVKLNWLNLPRMRRKLMKSVVEWHIVYDLCVQIVEGLDDDTIPETHIIHKLPEIIASFRLEVIRDIVFSGFQCELYAPQERPLAYWYLESVVQMQIECYDGLMPFVERGSRAWKDLKFKQMFARVVKGLASASLLIILPSATFDWDTLRPGFFKRYKWAFRSDYDRTTAEPVGHPELSHFMKFCRQVHYGRIEGEEHPALQAGSLDPRQHFLSAKSVLREMREGGLVSGWASRWEGDVRRVLEQLEAVCDRMDRGFLVSAEDRQRFDVKKRVKWDVGVHPWFPIVTPE